MQAQPSDATELALLLQQTYFGRYGSLAPVLSCAGEAVVADLDLAPVSADFPLWQRVQSLRAWGDPRQLVSGWVTLCAQLLGLGWVGPAYGPHQLGLRGGLVGVQGLQSIEGLASFVEARQAVEATLEELGRGVSRFLLGRPEARVAGPVREEALQHCRQELAAGRLLPPPLVQAVLPRPSFDRVVDEFRL